ncbi:MAG TPA: rhomboid family intramembrane serine protease [Gemmatimonadaceae bacterium]|nr:rhomboid family intramembrane serine protease [Gemmatimonadaceae bacterium]
MTSWVQRFLIANVLIFFVQQTMPGLDRSLVLVPALLLARPWTLVTYMFLHAGFTHILFNMLGLYFFGPRVEQRIGSSRFFALYMISGITGGLLSFYTPMVSIVGASGAIFGVLLAYARFWPRDQMLIWGIIPIEVRWLVLIYTLISLLGIGTGVAHFAHLGGFLGAFLYLLWMERSAGARKFRKVATAPPPAKDATLGNWRNVNRAGIHAVNKEEVDRILDKISASGLASLTPQERLFLSNFVPPDDRKPS